MEDFPEKAIAVLESERDAVVSGHMLRQRIDEVMLKPNVAPHGRAAPARTVQGDVELSRLCRQMLFPHA